MKEMDNILQGYVEEIEFLLEDDFVPVVEFLLVDPLSKKSCSSNQNVPSYLLLSIETSTDFSFLYSFLLYSIEY